MARDQGFVETLLGRRRFFPVLRTQATGQQANAIRQAARAAINHPIQGTAADIIKIAMSRLFQALNRAITARASPFRCMMSWCLR